MRKNMYNIQKYVNEAYVLSFFKDISDEEDCYILCYLKSWAVEVVRCAAPEQQLSWHPLRVLRPVPTYTVDPKESAQ